MSDSEIHKVFQEVANRFLEGYAPAGDDLKIEVDHLLSKKSKLIHESLINFTKNLHGIWDIKSRDESFANRISRLEEMSSQTSFDDSDIDVLPKFNKKDPFFDLFYDSSYLLAILENIFSNDYSLPTDLMEILEHLQAISIFYDFICPKIWTTHWLLIQKADLAAIQLVSKADFVSLAICYSGKRHDERSLGAKLAKQKKKQLWYQAVKESYLIAVKKLRRGTFTELCDGIRKIMKSRADIISYANEVGWDKALPSNVTIQRRLEEDPKTEFAKVLLKIKNTKK